MRHYDIAQHFTEALSTDLAQLEALVQNKAINLKKYQEYLAEAKQLEKEAHNLEEKINA